ncbi:hypothetical protein A5715_08425 [Mycolicibacter heraklionensis]|nr:hypothetical protein A5715_08425 [Mycolicibacter heraklionensis]
MAVRTVCADNLAREPVTQTVANPGGPASTSPNILGELKYRYHPLGIGLEAIDMRNFLPQCIPDATSFRLCQLLYSHFVDGCAGAGS